MASSISHAGSSTRTNSLDSISLKPAKAGLESQSASTLVNEDQAALRAIVSEVILRIGSQKAAALTMGIDQGQLSRQSKTGALTVERLEALGPVFYAELGRALTERFGEQAMSPRERARARIPELLQAFLEATA